MTLGARWLDNACLWFLRSRLFAANGEWSKVGQTSARRVVVVGSSSFARGRGLIDEKNKIILHGQVREKKKERALALVEKTVFLVGVEEVCLLAGAVFLSWVARALEPSLPSKVRAYERRVCGGGSFSSLAA